ncbi:hypothetical protein EDD21DRAFT_381456 [Dissophora ornata]|nr:hypothetical protein EDD21DRAFT_381456 [Dissophora ornata]
MQAPPQDSLDTEDDFHLLVYPAHPWGQQPFARRPLTIPKRLVTSLIEQSQRSTHASDPLSRNNRTSRHSPRQTKQPMYGPGSRSPGTERSISSPPSDSNTNDYESFRQGDALTAPDTALKDEGNDMKALAARKIEGSRNLESTRRLAYTHQNKESSKARDSPPPRKNQWRSKPGAFYLACVEIPLRQKGTNSSANPEGGSSKHRNSGRRKKRL